MEIGVGARVVAMAAAIAEVPRRNQAEFDRARAAGQAGLVPVAQPATCPTCGALRDPPDGAPRGDRGLS